MSSAIFATVYFRRKLYLAYGLSAVNIKLNYRTEDGWSQKP